VFINEKPVGLLPLAMTPTPAPASDGDKDEKGLVTH
jgi:hypothetical protein